MRRLLDTATAYARQGWRVLPLHWIRDDGRCSCGKAACGSPGKHPLAKLAPRGSRSATDNAATIRDWWSVMPSANVGVATGRESGIVVVDIDPRHGGDGSLLRLVEEHGDITDTLTVTTGSGGTHYYYRHPGRDVANSAGVLGDGIDVRGEGGYVVAPPSVHASGGSYAWITDRRTLADMPAWICPEPDAEGPARAQPVGDVIPHGTQHETLVSLAGTMRRRGMDADAIYAALWQINVSRCERPGTEAAIRKIAESMERYEPEEPVKAAASLSAWLSGQADLPDSDALDGLAALSPVEYDKCRAAAAERMGCRVSTLDAEVRARRPEKADDGEDLFEEPEPWPRAINGDDLLREVYDTIRRFVVFDEADAVACALWTLHSYTLDAAEASPILAITSPEKRCGKTTLLSVLRSLAYRPASGASFSRAAVYRVIERHGPTLLLDEADTFLKPGQNEELRGVINSGHTRGTAHVWVCVGDDHEPTRFSTWAPKAIACIGDLPDTIADRSIEVKMRRKTDADSVTRFRSRVERDLLPLRRRIRRWADDHGDVLADSDPDVPRSLNDRAADSWATLLAIADRAGGDWPRRARLAAETLSGSTTADVATRGTELLSDIREIFESKRMPDALPTADILDALHAMEERPWPTYHRGKELSARGLASLLKPFEVASITVRLADGSTPKGYKLEGLHDAFARYLPPTSATPPQSEKDGDAEPETAIMTKNASATKMPKAGRVADRKTTQNGDSEPETANTSDLWRVAGKNGGSGGKGGTLLIPLDDEPPF